MRKRYIISLLVLILACICAQAKGKLVKCTMDSRILGVEKRFNVYLPEGYDKGSDYPVLYMLHGATSCCDVWTDKYAVHAMLDRRISSGMCVPMVLVFPDAPGDDPVTRRGLHQGYFNYPDWRYEDYFFQELIPYVEKNWKVRSDRGGRAIAGISMGGGGAAIYAMHHPELFGSCCPIEGRIGDYEYIENSKKALEPEYRRLILENNLIKYLSEADAETQKAIGSVRWFMTVGDDDYMLKGNHEMYFLMKELGFGMVQLRTGEGVHGGEYARLWIPDIFTFVSIGFSL